MQSVQPRDRLPPVSSATTTPTTTTSTVTSRPPRRRAPRLSHATLLRILQYTPHTPSICCAAASPGLRYARQYVAGQRVQHGEPHRGDLYLCWDPAQSRACHRYQGDLEELIRDLRYISWWIARRGSGNGGGGGGGEAVPLEVEVKQRAAVAARSPQSGLPLLLELLTVLTTPPIQTATDSCVRALCVSPRHLHVDPACMAQLSRLTRLERLELRSDHVCHFGPTSASLPLRELRVRHAADLTSLQCLAPLRHLRRIEVTRCTALSDVSLLAQLPLVEEVHIADCARLSLRGDYAACARLRVVSVQWCASVTGAQSLCTVPQLAELDLSFSQVQDLAALWRCAGVRRLVLRGCGAAGELIEAVERQVVQRDGHALGRACSHSSVVQDSVLSTLEVLDVGESALTSVAGLAHAPYLRALSVRECPLLQDLDPLGAVATLESIDASYSGVERVSGLTRSARLRSINLRACGRLTDLSPLASIATLEEVVTPTVEQGGKVRVPTYEAADVAGTAAAGEERTREQFTALLSSATPRELVPAIF